MQAPVRGPRAPPQVQQSQDVQAGAEAQFSDHEAVATAPGVGQPAPREKDGARLGQTVGFGEIDVVEAVRALGATDVRVIVRHILPNIMQPVIVQAAIGMAGAVLAEATMSFLGLGVPPPTASWGSMLNDARAHLFDSPHMVVFPAAAVMLAVLSFNFIGDALRDYMDPRSRIEAGL